MKLTKEQALEYVKKRYPEQKEIYDDYLKSPVVMVIKHV
jgi:hypothetical protein